MNIIFHIPLKIDRNDPSASQIRPRRLMEAFGDLGYSVDVVEGYGRQRRRQIAQIKRKIRGGVQYAFLYSESSTMPTLLTERHHLPLYPWLDFAFFDFCRHKGIPIGLFYRDIHWLYANRHGGLKQWVARFFYRYDLRRYERLLDVLFLPTSDMMQHIPMRPPASVVQLPSGCVVRPVVHQPKEGVEVLYVGGIGGNYDLRAFVQAVAQVEGVHLTLCCRDYDWEGVRADYEPLMNGHISVVHLSEGDLGDCFSKADVSAIFFTPNDYLAFAAPFKLFETIGYGVPVMASAGTWTARFVKENRLGLVCENSLNSIVSLLRQLLAGPSVLQQYREQVSAFAHKNTWQARCRQIADALMPNDCAL